ILLKDKELTPLEERLENLRHDKDNSQYVYLLYQGKTGSLLKELEQKSTPPDGIANALSSELIKLKKQRGGKNYFRTQNAILLEEKIEIFEKLQALIKTNNLPHALAQLSPDESAILNRYDSSFIRKLKSLERNMNPEYSPKTILGAGDMKNDSVILEESAQSENKAERDEAIKLIDEKICVLKSSSPSGQNLKRLEILMNLKSRLELSPNMSVDAAISALKKDPHLAKEDILLLFKGQLGKTIKAAQHLTITRAELIHRLDIEINHIKQQRYTRLYIFSNNHRKILEDRIQSLQEIKMKLQSSDNNQSVVSIVHDLSPHHKAVLKRYEPDLLKELEKLKKLSVENTAPRNTA
ncbi:MAG: hypothetical protein K0S63_385, partial [Gammaproteobacteria bacterium]|nr:hypothetical protein [Gammaproteobacteria bacterium]